MSNEFGSIMQKQQEPQQVHNREKFSERIGDLRVSLSNLHIYLGENDLDEEERKVLYNELQEVNRKILALLHVLRILGGRMVSNKKVKLRSMLLPILKERIKKLWRRDMNK
jgi:hypothetical protein